jgi:hypothetical protein
VGVVTFDYLYRARAALDTRGLASKKNANETGHLSAMIHRPACDDVNNSPYRATMSEQADYHPPDDVAGSAQGALWLQLYDDKATAAPASMPLAWCAICRAHATGGTAPLDRPSTLTK